MPRQTRRLGRGLSSLISEPVSIPAEPIEDKSKAFDSSFSDIAETSPSGLRSVRLSSIVPNRNQPRERFSEDSLSQLAESIRVAGVIQPIIVRPLPAGAGGPEGAEWELIAGERRWRAAGMAGLELIPAVIADLSDRESAEWALVENLQREDLNPVERAKALRGLRDEFGLTQSQVAERVGLDRATVANLIRLMDLEPEILEMLGSGLLGAGHGKALLSIQDNDFRLRTAKRAASEGWSVRRLEAAASAPAESTSTPPQRPAPEHSAHLRRLEKELGDHLGTKLSIKQKPNQTSGRIVIRYFDLDHFQSLMEKLGYQ